MSRPEPAMILRFTVDEQPFTLALTDQIGFGLTPREAGRIKTLASGTAGIRLLEAVRDVDVEVLAALAIVAMERSGASPNTDAILDGKAILGFSVDAPVSDVDPTVAADTAAADTNQTSLMIPAGSGIPS